MTKADARALARQRADGDGLVMTVVRHRSKFAAMTAERAKREGFYVMEVVKPNNESQDAQVANLIAEIKK
jgi:hypothetical protein